MAVTGNDKIEIFLLAAVRNLSSFAEFVLKL